MSAEASQHGQKVASKRKRRLELGMNRFLIVLTPDRENGGYTVTAPSLPGCVSDGQTVDEAIERARDAIAVYLEGEDAESLAAAGVHSDQVLVSVDVPAKA